MSQLPVSEIPDHFPKKQTVQPGEAFEDTPMKHWFEIVK
jgi:hypothetical protein